MEAEVSRESASSQLLLYRGMKDVAAPDSFMADGGTVWACPPCSSLRGYTEEQFLDGVEITGAGPVYDLIREGAATICL